VLKEGGALVMCKYALHVLKVKRAKAREREAADEHKQEAANNGDEVDDEHRKYGVSNKESFH